MYASKYRRGGVWYLKWREPGEAAARWKSLGTRSERKASAELRILKARLSGVSFADSGGPSDSSSDAVGSDVAAVAGPSLAHLPPRTVGELVALFLAWAETYYIGADGRATGELDALRAAVAPLSALHAGVALDAFGPRALKSVRAAMVNAGWVRSTVNKQLSRVKRCFSYGVENEWVSPTVLEGLRAVKGLRRGRSVALEADPVVPVPDAAVKAVLKVAPSTVCAMIMSQLLTAARPGEIVILRPMDFDCSGPVWIATPSTHKTEYRGRAREIYFGPQAQTVLKPFMDRAADAFLFSPLEAHDERYDTANAPEDVLARRAVRRKLDGRRRPGARYTVRSYRRCIARMCESLEIYTWCPNRLRHNAGTEIRRIYGLEAAQVILGHARADVTQVYAEVNRTRAVALMREIG